MLKPSRELFEIQKDYPGICKQIILAGYMSFNIRSLFKIFSKEDIVNFLHGFKLVIYYETFLATGEKIV
jgi:hypothetical protein